MAKTKLLKNIKARLTDQKFPLLDSRHIATISYTEQESGGTTFSVKGREIRVDVILGASQLIDEEILNLDYDAVMQHAKNVVGREIAEHVYGDIRRGLIELAVEMRREHSYSLERSKSLQLIEDMLVAITYD